LSAGGDLRGYAICGEPRTGSSYLCQILTSTGVLGRPLEYFNGPGMAKFQPGYPQQAEDQLSEILRQGATENGVYGVKIFSATFDRVAGTGWTRRLPNLRFISLTRRDLLAQAISAVRAVQTGQYSSHDQGAMEPVYDSARLIEEIRTLAWGHARWAAFFARCGLAPLHLHYEEVAARPQQAADAVARLLGLGETATVDFGKVDAQVQRDSTSTEWRARFLAEAHDPTWLDRPSYPSIPSRLRSKMRRQLRQWIGSGSG
jgi:LPS sulfotransferase NodH